MKALKLKGWVDGIVGTRSKAEIASANWFAVKVVPDMARATLVIGEERVFTESEVRDFLLKIRRDYHAVEDIEFLDTLTKDELDIVLNPA